VGGGEEGFEGARDDEQGDGSGEELDGFEAGEGDGGGAGEHAGEEDARGEAEAGGSGDHDAGELEGAVGGDEAPEAEGHVVLAANDGDGSEHEAVVEEGVEGEEAGGDSSGEGEEADHDVVGHDAGGGFGLDAEDAVGPHLVVVEVGDGLGAEEHDTEVGADHDDEGSESAGEQADERGGEEVAGEATQQARVAVGEELPDAGEGDALTGVDVVVGSGDEAVEVLG